MIEALKTISENKCFCGGTKNYLIRFKNLNYDLIWLGKLTAAYDPVVEICKLHKVFKFIS
jgi:hypothetical protein